MLRFVFISLFLMHSNMAISCYTLTLASRHADNPKAWELGSGLLQVEMVPPRLLQNVSSWIHKSIGDFAGVVVSYNILSLTFHHFLNEETQMALTCLLLQG